MSKNNVKKNVKGSVKKNVTKTTNSTKRASGLSINWNLLFKDNKQAVKDFAAGDCGLRTMINSLKTKAAKSEGYRLERNTNAAGARNRAKKALSRNR